MSEATVLHEPNGVARRDLGVSADPFPLSAVTLLPGPLHDQISRTHARLKSLDPDRLLHTFRRNAGLPSEMVPCTGWESPAAEQRGHTTGHVLTALAQAFATTGDRAFSVRAHYLVDQLALCQDRARFAGFSTGYLSAFPEGFIGRLEAGEPVQAPYGTLHKIMAGLLDVHLLVGGTRALTVLTRMAAWVGWRIGRLSQAHRHTVLATEFGGMNEVLANLYQATGDPAHLTTARYFDHAYARLPAALGAIRLYHATGETRYRDIAVHCWENAADECRCSTHDLRKLTHQLFRGDPGQIRYFDYYEQSLNDREPDTRDDFSCCYGTGMATEHRDSIYFHAGNVLYVNLFVPSVLSWAGRGVLVRQDPATRLTITGSGWIDLRVRVPSWAQGAVLRVNGVAEQPVTAGTYARVDRHWVSGDVVDLSLP